MKVVGVTAGEGGEPAAALLRALGERAETEHVPVELERGSELRQTAAAIAALEPRLGGLRPAAVLVGGDGIDAVAASLVAVKLEMPLVRLGAGVRSGDRHERAEINRRVADHVCDLLLCTDEGQLENLRREGLAEKAELVADPATDPGPAADAVLACLAAYTSRA